MVGVSIRTETCVLVLNVVVHSNGQDRCNRASESDPEEDGLTSRPSAFQASALITIYDSGMDDSKVENPGDKEDPIAIKYAHLERRVNSQCRK
jgi:hypothetical protein